MYVKIDPNDPLDTMPAGEFFFVALFSFFLAIFIGVAIEKFMRNINIPMIPKIILQITLLIITLIIVNNVVFKGFYRKIGINTTLPGTIFFIAAFMSVQQTLFYNINKLFNLQINQA